MTSGAKLSKAFDADEHSTLGMRFEVADARGRPLKPQQAFAVFEQQASRQEIIFVAEASKTGALSWTVVRFAQITLSVLIDVIC